MPWGINYPGALAWELASPEVPIVMEISGQQLDWTL